MTDANFAGLSDDPSIRVRDTCPKLLVPLTQVSEDIRVLSTRVMDSSFAGRSDDPAIPVQTPGAIGTSE